MEGWAVMVQIVGRFEMLQKQRPDAVEHRALATIP